MEIDSGGTGGAIPAAPVPNEGTETVKNRIRAVLSSDKLEMVCRTLLIPSNMKQFGFMLGVTKQGRMRPRSGDVIKAFCKYLNESERVKLAGWFVGEDAMTNGIKKSESRLKLQRTEKMKVQRKDIPMELTKNSLTSKQLGNG